jgi:hypothetical protein
MFCQEVTLKRGSSVHVAPACTGSGDLVILCQAEHKFIERLNTISKMELSRLIQ